MSSNLSVKLPSNNITATDREIKGNNKFPNNTSGLSKFNTGPARIPAVKRKRIDGIRTHQANH
jgi:hypothetical protein